MLNNYFTLARSLRLPFDPSAAQRSLNFRLPAPY